MKKKILSALLGAIAFPALAFAQAPAAALPDADPAMWVVRIRTRPSTCSAPFTRSTEEGLVQR
jgi:hypothetical protein